jgi:hypothetical protein
MEPTPRVYGRGTFFYLKKGKLRGVLCPKDKVYKIFNGGVKLNWPQLNSLCSSAG